MRDQIVRSKDGSPVVAWVLAVVFLALVAVPTFWPGDHVVRTPGVIDIGTPGASLATEGAALPRDAVDQPLDFADRVTPDSDAPPVADATPHDQPVAEPADEPPAM